MTAGAWDPAHGALPVDSPQQVNDSPHVTETSRLPFPMSAANTLGVKEAGVEFWQALFAAQDAVSEIGHDGQVDKSGGKVGKDGTKEAMYTYASATGIMREARRVLRANKLVVVQTGVLSTGNARGQRTALVAGFLVAHSPSAQGVFFPFDWAVHATEKFQPPKACGAAYTQSLRYFLRGLLQIVTSEDPKEDPEHIYDAGRVQPIHDQWQGQSQQQVPQLPMHPQPWNQQQAPWQGQQQAQPAQQQWQGQQWQGQQPQQQWQGQQRGPITQDPTVQFAQQQLGAEPMNYQQQYQQTAASLPQQAQFSDPQFSQSRPPQQQAPQQQAPQQQAPQQAGIPGARVPAGFMDEAGGAPPDQRPGEPSDVDTWATMLISRGFTQQKAQQLCVVELEKPISDYMREHVRGFMNEYYGNDGTAASAAWGDTGFVPRPDLADNVRPRPTGVQALRYLAKMDWAKKRGSNVNANVMA